MERARLWAEAQDGLGVWFPSPSEYEPTAFLAALSDVTAARFETDYDQRTGRTTKAAKRRYFVSGIGVQLLVYVALLLFFAGSGSRLFGAEITRYLNGYTLAGVLLLVSAGWLYTRALTQRREDRYGLGRVRRAAEELRQQVRFIVTTKESSEVAGEAKHAGIGARLKRASERQLVERPATLSSLVHNFRAFAELMAREMTGPVVIAIDELDKMSDAQKVADLLRDIKGVFDIPGVYFLVSLSDEAARSLDLGALRSRNEFNSSFYTVLSLPALTPEKSLELLRLRDKKFDDHAGRAIGVITNGIPREIIRVADSAYTGTPVVPSVQTVVIHAARDEYRTFLDEVLTARRNGLEASEQLALWECLSDNGASDPRNFPGFAVRLLARWNINDESLPWCGYYQEPWRRLIIRMIVAALIVARPQRLADGANLDRLQDISRLASSSAAVARARLGGQLIAEMSNNRTKLGQSTQEEINLALFLLQRGRLRFTAREYNVCCDAKTPAAHALEAFRAAGILDVRRTGLSKHWLLTERASHVLPPLTPILR